MGKRAGDPCKVRQGIGWNRCRNLTFPPYGQRVLCTLELHLKDGRIIRDLDDAASFGRKQEVRPGVDQRDEVLHKIECAQNKEEAMLRPTPLYDGWKSWTSLNRRRQRAGCADVSAP